MKRKRKENHIRILAVSLCIGMISAFLAGGPSGKERQIQQKIADNILRFHVLANSDSRKDQEKKLQVRDAVIREMRPLLTASASKAETKALIAERMDQIQETAARTAETEQVRVSLVTDWFPEKTYGSCTFPEGEYEALRIEIGKAKGHNWWCVLYPAMCFSEAVKPVVSEDGKETWPGVLETEELDFVLHPVKTRIRFRWLQKILPLEVLMRTE